MAKVLQTLVEAGLARSQRGLGGGFTLLRPASEISVLDVVNAVEPIERIRTCPLNLDEHQAQLCPLHRKLDDALATVESAFASTRVAELVDSRQGSTPLCSQTGSGDGASVSAASLRKTSRGSRGRARE